jgi:hypothetical protein
MKLNPPARELAGGFVLGLDSRREQRKKSRGIASRLHMLAIPQTPNLGKRCNCSGYAPAQHQIREKYEKMVCLGCVRTPSTPFFRPLTIMAERLEKDLIFGWILNSTV